MQRRTLPRVTWLVLAWLAATAVTARGSLAAPLLPGALDDCVIVVGTGLCTTLGDPVDTAARPPGGLRGTQRGGPPAAPPAGGPPTWPDGTRMALLAMAAGSAPAAVAGRAGAGRPGLPGRLAQGMAALAALVPSGGTEIDILPGRVRRAAVLRRAGTLRPSDLAFPVLAVERAMVHAIYDGPVARMDTRWISILLPAGVRRVPPLPLPVSRPQGVYLFSPDPRPLMPAPAAVSPVPLAGAVWPFLGGVALLGFATRRRKRG
ncbi:MAG: hypothetical protein ACOY4T_02440 [Pseudomonadota bacterium]